MTPHQSLAPSALLSRHRHSGPYVAIVLSGSYQEAGDRGRWRVGPGDALAHEPYEAHFNMVERRGAKILNLPLPHWRSFPPSFKVDDPDSLARAAERDVLSAASMLEAGSDNAPRLDDWPDRLAGALRANPALRLNQWAAQLGIAPETISRGFRSAFGTTPGRFRAEVRARNALHALAENRLPLAEIAQRGGFADQAHFTRAIARLTGLPPGRWRATSSWFNTASRFPAKPLAE